MDYYAAVRAFLYAADYQSFSKAAQRLNIKTSTVSRHISSLEDDLGIALFNRSTRGLTLTEGGMTFREHATIAQQSLENAKQITASLNTTPQGNLRVTMPVSFGRRHIIKHLPKFLEQYPNISIDAVISDEVINLVDTGIDLAIRIGCLSNSQLIARKLAEHRRIVCASPDYIAKHGIPKTPDDLSQHQVLRFTLVGDDKWFMVRKADSTSEKQTVITRLQGAIQANDTESIISLAVAGYGIALLPNWSVNEALQSGQLVHLLPEWLAQVGHNQSEVWAVYPPKKSVSSKVRAFIDFYAELFNQPEYWNISQPL